MANSAIGTPTFLAKVQNLTDNDGTSFSQFIPAGVVLPFAGTTAPAGFLLCNGIAVSRTTYSKLFAAIGTAHGAGDGSTDFCLPDYRGRFLRGTDGGAARDPDRVGRTAANSGGATGDAVGSVQGNATAKNGLTATSTAPTFTGSGITSGSTSSTGSHGHNLGYGANIFGGGIPTPAGTANGSSNMTGDNGSHSHTVTGTSAGSNSTPTVTVGVGDNETRPLNANVNYIIKI